MNDFAEPKNVAVFTTVHIIRGGEPICYVSHEIDDGAWQFHTGYDNPGSADAMIVSLREMIDHDPTICELSDLPRGWFAERAKRGAQWMRKKCD